MSIVLFISHAERKYSIVDIHLNKNSSFIFFLGLHGRIGSQICMSDNE